MSEKSTPPPRIFGVQTCASYVEALKVLSTREIEVLDLTLHGYTNVEIATRFTLSLLTIETHKKNIQSLKLPTECLVGMPIPMNTCLQEIGIYAPSAKTDARNKGGKP